VSLRESSGQFSRVETESETEYAPIWVEDFLNDWSVSVGSSGAGDSDNDGRDEMIFQPLVEGTFPNPIRLMENDDCSLVDYCVAHEFGANTATAPTILVADLDSTQSGPQDCDDGEELIHPGALEICSSGIDEDCDGSAVPCFCVDLDADTHDSYDPVSCRTGTDCNDRIFDVKPGAPEICDDLLDNDCDGLFDCDDGACSGDVACLSCLPVATRCTSAEECCSDKCVGKAGAKTCK
jgi:hypothetical protein